MNNEFCAKSIREKVLESIELQNIENVRVLSVNEGEHSNQLGNFNIEIKNKIVGICTWLPSTVEVQITNSINGETEKIETFENTTINESANEIIECINNNA